MITTFEDHRMSALPARIFYHAEGGKVSAEPVAFADTPPAVLTIRDATLPAGQGVVRTGDVAFYAGPATGGWSDEFLHSLDGSVAWSEETGEVIARRMQPTRVIPEGIFMNFGSSWFGFRVLNLAALALVREAIGDRRVPIIIRAKESEAPDNVQIEAVRRIFGHEDIIALRTRVPETLVERLHVAVLPIQFRRKKVYYSSVALDLLRRYLGIPASPPLDRKAAKRIYVSRRDVGRRVVDNEDEVVRVLEEHGFTVTETTGMSLEQRLDIFRDAEIVAGNIGSNMINALFAPSGCWVVQFVPTEFDRTPHNRDALGNIACGLGQKYLRVSATSALVHTSKLLEAGVTVPLESLRSALDFMEASLG